MSNRDIEILREVVIKVTKLLAGQSIQVTQRGARAYAKADKSGKPYLVNIPFIPDTATPGFLAAIQGFIDHEVGHILFTDWSVQKTIAKDAKLHSCWNLVEDPFIERMMTKKFPGCAYNLDKVYGYFIEHITEPALAEASSEIQEFGVLVVPVIRALSGQAVFDRWLTENGHYEHPLVKAFFAQMPKASLAKLPTISSTREALAIARDMHAVLHPPKPVAPPAPPPPPTPSAPPEEKGEGEPEDDKPAPGMSPEEKPHKPEDKPAPAPEDESEEKPAGAPLLDDPEAEGEPAPEEEPEDDEPAAPPAEPEPEPEAEDEEAEEPGPGSASTEEELGGLEDEEPEADEGSSAGKDDGDDGSVGAEADDENGDEGEGSGAAGGGTDEEGAAEEKDEEAEAEEEPDPETAGGAGSSSFEGGSEDELDLTKADYEKALAEHLTELSTAAARAEQYVIYSKDFDKVERYKVDAGYKDEWLTKLDDQVGRMIGVMQKDIERMMAARSRVQQVPGFRSGRLHSGALHRLTTGDDRVFRRKHDAKSKETDVTLLIDNSGSMSGQKMTVAMQAGYALSLTLERVGIRHEVIGFTTLHNRNSSEAKAESERIGRRWTRTEPLNMPVFKGFDERLNPAVKKRFAHAIEQQGFLRNNVDGECIDIAAHRLLQQKGERKVLIVLSDGVPAAETHDPYALMTDCSDAVKRATKRGVETIGIGIMSSAVERFYPKHVVLNDLAELPRIVMSQLRSILAAA